MSHDPAPGEAAATGFWRSRYALGLLFFGAVSAYLLFSEHRAHFLSALPLLLLLSCPLVHVFMHHGHGHRAGGPPHGEPADRDDVTSTARPTRPAEGQP